MKVQEALNSAILDLEHAEERSNCDYGNSISKCKSALAEIEKCEPVAWQFFKDGVWWYGNQDEYHKHKTYEAGLPIRNLYTTPQRQKPLKRLDDSKIKEFTETAWFCTQLVNGIGYGFDAVKFANAIMDEMERINNV